MARWPTSPQAKAKEGVRATPIMPARPISARIAFARRHQGLSHFGFSQLLIGTDRPRAMPTRGMPKAECKFVLRAEITAEDRALCGNIRVIRVRSSSRWPAARTTARRSRGSRAPSFTQAPARCCVSHWAVNSDATVKLVSGAVAAMEEKPNIGRAEALQEAMLALIGKGAHPADWAPFVVAGEGGQSILHRTSVRIDGDNSLSPASIFRLVGRIPASVAVLHAILYIRPFGDGGELGSGAVQASAKVLPGVDNRPDFIFWEQPLTLQLRNSVPDLVRYGLLQFGFIRGSAWICRSPS